MSLSDTPVGVALANAATGKPSIAVGVSASLTLKLANNSGADIALDAGASPAAFAVAMPKTMFTAEQVGAMSAMAPGWRATANGARYLITIACTQAATWAQGETVTFTIGDVVSSGPPGGGNVTIGPSGMSGDVPLALPAALAVAAPPAPGNLSLADVLQVTLDNQGTVYRSVPPSDPLPNTLYLTLKNTGATALATGGTSPLPGSPTVTVWFVYGNTSGALAPDNPGVGAGQAPIGSAWNIKLAPQSTQTAWSPHNPAPGDPLQWTITPAVTNLTILGPAGTDEANATFALSNLVTFNPLGHTQMLVLCSGFRKDAAQKYDDHLFVLDVNKQDAPPNRGLVSFFGAEPVIAVTDPAASVPISLRWTMFDVASVQLISSSPAVVPRRVAYPKPQPLAYDQATMTLPPLHASEAVFATLQAFDGNGGYLNSLQFVAYAQVSYVTDPAGRVYAIKLIGDTFWMTQNYAYETQQGSWFYNDDPMNDTRYGFGRLYDLEAARASIPPGWELPSVADWHALFDRYHDPAGAYAALVEGGVVGFDARLGGRRGNDGSYSDGWQYGYCWTAEGRIAAQFSSLSGGSASVGGSWDSVNALSVRYIRHV